MTKALAAAIALLFVPLAVPLFTGRVFPFGDLTALHLPLRHDYQQALLHGDAFLWSPAFAGGVYLHAEGQAGMMHPLHLLLYRLVPLPAAFNLEMLASYVFALAGMMLLLRRLGLASTAAAFGGMLFAFSGFTLMHFLHLNLVAVVAHIPWLLLGTDIVSRAGTGGVRAGGVALVAATLGSEILLGFPQAVWFSVVALLWFVAYRIAGGISLARIALLAAALIAGMLLGAIQLLPTLDLARESFRADATMDFRLSYSLHPANLIQLVSPYLLGSRFYAPDPAEQTLHEFAIYDGVVPLLCVAWIVVRWRHLAHRRLAIALLTLAILGIVLALGRYGGLYPLLAQLPGLSMLRASGRHIVLTHFALAGLAAVALDDAIRHLGDRRARVMLAVVILAAAVDIGLWGYRYVWQERPVTVASVVPTGLPGDVQPGDLLHPYRNIDRVNQHALGGYRTTWAAFGLYSDPVLPLRDPQTWRLLGVRWAWGRDRWFRLDDTMPRARLVANWRLITDPDDPTADLREIDIAEAALVDSPPGDTVGPPGRVTVVRDRPGSLQFATDAPGTQLLVVAERFHHGWRATVDGHRVPVRRTYVDLLGCVVPAGAHRVELEFAPASFAWGWRLSLLGVLLTVVAAFAARVDGWWPAATPLCRLRSSA